MPELPEVETVVRDLRPQLVGRRIATVTASPQMARSTTEPWEQCLPGRRFASLERHGKWMFFRLSGGPTMVVHLGMTGRLGVHPVDQPIPPHTHLRLGLDGGAFELRFTDPRRFGALLLCDPATFTRQFGASRLGPDALAITPRQFAAALATSSRRIKAVLLDQKKVAGVGNIYADEALFAARIHPATPVPQLGADAQRRLWRSVRHVLRQSIAHQGTTLRDYVTGQGVPGAFQLRLKVYGRVGKPCRRCRAPIVLDRTIVTGRATYLCPCCQPADSRDVVFLKRSDNASANRD